MDDQLTTALTQVEDLLLAMAAWQQKDPHDAWPGPPAGPASLAAVRRLWDAIAPTQGGRAAAAGNSGRVLAPGGRYEHLPLRVAHVRAPDIPPIAAVAAVISDPDAAEHVRQPLEQSARTAYGTGDNRACAALAATTANLGRLLGLPCDRDTLYLTALVSDSPRGSIVLSQAGEAAYQRYATRASMAWSPGDPLHRWMY